LQRRFEALEKLLRVARKYGAALVLLSQVNGKGDVNGGERVKHVPDAVVDIEGSENSDKVTLRIVEKNRFGPKGLSAGLRMTGKGFQWLATA
jgi:predicted ATP-dependent serine protease